MGAIVTARVCGSCAFWDGDDRAAFAACTVGRLPGRVPIYCDAAQHCQSYTVRATDDQQTMQSRARGDAPGSIMGVKLP